GRTGQLFFPDLDIEKVLLKHVEEVNRDFYLTEAVRDNIGAIRKASEMQENVDSRKLLEQLYKALRDRVVTDYRAKFIQRDVFNKIVDNMRTTSLATPLRYVPELTSNLFRHFADAGFSTGRFRHKAYAEVKNLTNSV